MIHEAAILCEGDVYTVPCPGRHHDVIEKIIRSDVVFKSTDTVQGS